MAPAHPTIKELDGLPSGEIELRIAQSEQRSRETLGSRLDAQDTRLDNMQDDLSILVGTAKLQGLVQSVKITVEGLVVKGDQWHEEDITYRAAMIQRVTSIEEKTEALTSRVERIGWFVYCSDKLSQLLAKLFRLLSTEEFWKVAGVGIMLYTMSKVSPWLFHIVAPIFGAITGTGATPTPK